LQESIFKEGVAEDDLIFEKSKSDVVGKLASCVDTPDSTLKSCINAAVVGEELDAYLRWDLCFQHMTLLI
jgi:hypothetical protein